MITFNRAELAALAHRLQALKTKDGKAAARKAAGRALLPVRQQAKASAPYDPDTPVHIRKEIAMRGRWRGDVLFLRVGVKGGARKNPDSPFWFRFQEFGTRHIPAKPFLVPALSDNEQRVYDALVLELKKELFA